MTLSNSQKLTATTAPYIRFLENLDQTALPEAGGKGANLGELIKAGLPVPPGFVVTADAYRVHLESAHLPERIAIRLHNLVSEDMAAVTAASDDIMSWIIAAPILDMIREAVASSYADLTTRVIV